MRILLILLAISLPYYHQTLQLSHVVGSRNATANCMTKNTLLLRIQHLACESFIIHSIKRYDQNCYLMEAAKAEYRALRFKGDTVISRYNTGK